jgi:hypothetical protein
MHLLDVSHLRPITLKWARGRLWQCAEMSGVECRSIVMRRPPELLVLNIFSTRSAAAELTSVHVLHIFQWEINQLRM